MQRYTKNYQHTDFSALLEELQEKRETEKRPVETEAVSAGPAAVSKTKRIRASLMSNPLMKYVVSLRTGEFHDRECSWVKNIPDEEFGMVPGYLNSEYSCPECGKKTIIRCGLNPKEQKRIDSYCYVLEKLGAQQWDLRGLFVEHDAALLHVEKDRVLLYNKNNYWMLRTAPEGCALFWMQGMEQQSLDRWYDYPALHKLSGSFKDCVETILGEEETESFRDGKTESIEEPEAQLVEIESFRESVPEINARRIEQIEGSKRKFVLDTKRNLLHDRDCPEVLEIPEEHFSMTSILTRETKICQDCGRRVLIRSCLAKGEAIKMNHYCNVLSVLEAGTVELRRMAFGMNAELYDVGWNLVYLRVPGERWAIQKNGAVCGLYHLAGDKSDSELLAEANPETGLSGSFRDCLGRIQHYKQHLSDIQKAAHRKALSEAAANSTNVTKIRKFSLFHKYYMYVDCVGRHKALGGQFSFRMDIKKIHPVKGTPCSVVVCKIRRWEKKLFMVAMNAMKRYSVETECDDYADVCMRYISKRITLKQALLLNTCEDGVTDIII